MNNSLKILILSAISMTTILLVGLSSNLMAAPKTCTGAKCTAGDQCTLPDGATATCGSWGSDTCKVRTTDQAVADHTCRCNFDKTYDCASGTAPIIGGKANAATRDRTVEGGSGGAKKGPKSKPKGKKRLKKKGK